LNGTNPVCFELPFTRQEGRGLTLRFELEPILKDGEVIGLRGICRNVTTAKRTRHQTLSFPDTLVQDGAVSDDVGSVSDKTEFKAAEADLMGANTDLKRRVKEKTRELRKTSIELMTEIRKRKEAEQESEMRARDLEEVNCALKVLIENRAGEKDALEDKVLKNFQKNGSNQLG
jgi:hypothetical protein